MVGWLEQAFQTGTLNNIFQRKRLPEKWVCNLVIKIKSILELYPKLYSLDLKIVWQYIGQNTTFKN